MEFKQIKELIETVGKMEFTHFEIQEEDFKLLIKNEKINNNISESYTKNEEIENKLEEKHTNISENKPIKLNEEKNIKIIKAPMVGTYYSSPSPESKAYVEIGKGIIKEDTLCIIEAMKVMNEILSEYTGTIVEIFVNNGDIVEYGQPIMSIKI